MPNPIFQLKLHLPYRALRRCRPQSKVSRKWQHKCANVTFLKRRPSGVTGQEIYRIYRAHISLVLSGSSDRRWVAYCFDDDGFDGEDDDFEEDEDDESEDDESEDILPHASQDDNCPFVEDPLTQTDANKPIWIAREYFVLAVQNQMARAVREWTYLVRWIERNINSYVCGYFFSEVGYH